MDEECLLPPAAKDEMEMKVDLTFREPPSLLPMKSFQGRLLSVGLISSCVAAMFKRTCLACCGDGRPEGHLPVAVKFYSWCTMECKRQGEIESVLRVR